jgi:MYXO-CTERM domain-containing protein
MFRTGLALSAAAVLCAQAHGQIINPISYSMHNGEGMLAGGQWNYHDEAYSGLGAITTDLAPLSGGLGQLTDGVIATNYLLDLGNGPAFEWVAWTTIDPVITFDFGSEFRFDLARVWMSASEPVGSVDHAARVTTAGSLDGLSFAVPQVHDLIANPPESVTPLELSLAGARGRYLRLELARNNGWWVFVSEVQFEGAPVPAPGALGLLAAAGLAACRRRR